MCTFTNPYPMQFSSGTSANVIIILNVLVVVAGATAVGVAQYCSFADHSELILNECVVVLLLPENSKPPRHVIQSNA